MILLLIMLICIFKCNKQSVQYCMCQEEEEKDLDLKFSLLSRLVGIEELLQSVKAWYDLHTRTFAGGRSCVIKWLGLRFCLLEMLLESCRRGICCCWCCPSLCCCSGRSSIISRLLLVMLYLTQSEFKMRALHMHNRLLSRSGRVFWWWRQRSRRRRSFSWISSTATKGGDIICCCCCGCCWRLLLLLWLLHQCYLDDKARRKPGVVRCSFACFCAQLVIVDYLEEPRSIRLAYTWMRLQDKKSSNTTQNRKDEDALPLCCALPGKQFLGWSIILQNIFGERERERELDTERDTQKHRNTERHTEIYRQRGSTSR